MSDDLEALEDEFEADASAAMLIVEEDADGELSLSTAIGNLTENDRIAMLLRALLLELGPDIVGVLQGLSEDEDDE